MEKAALVLKLRAEVIISIRFLKPKNRTNLCDEGFNLPFLKRFVLYFCLWGNSVGTATERRRRYTSLGNKDRLMKTLAPKMSQNNHLQIDHYKVKHFLACCLSHGLISLGKRKKALSFFFFVLLR